MNSSIWRSGLTCYIASLMSLNFSLLSPFLLSFLAFSRLMVVEYPSYTSFKNSTYILKYILSLSILTVLVTTTLLIITKIYHGHSPMSLCSPLIDPTDRVTMIQILTLLTVIVQVCTIFFICIVSTRMIKQFKQSQEKMQGAKSKRNQSSVAIITQIMIITGCWIPSGAIYLTTIFLEKYPINCSVTECVGASRSLPIANDGPCWTDMVTHRSCSDIQY